MKLLFLGGAVPEARTGGQMIYREFLRTAREAGHQVTEAGEILRPLSQQLRARAGPVRRLAGLLSGNVRALWGLRSYRPDVILLDSEESHDAVLFSWWKRLGGATVVTQVNHFSNYGAGVPERGRAARWLRRWMERINLSPAHTILAPSQFTVAEVLSLGISARRVVMIQPGFQSHLPTDLQAEPWRRATPARLLFVGTVEPRKGLHHLIEALAALPPRLVRLDVVGRTDKDPEYFERLRRLVQELALSDDVVFWGWLDGARLVERYRQAQVFVFPSLKAGFGLAVLEAMCAGLPVIVSDNSAISGWAPCAECGLPAEAGDIAQWSQAIRELAEDPALRAAMGRTGREHVRRWPTQRQQAQRMLRAIEQLRENCER